VYLALAGTEKSKQAGQGNMKICAFCSKLIEDEDYPSHIENHQAEMVEIRELMDVTAADLAQRVPDVSRWGGWVVYLLETLETKATDPAGYETMLYTLRNVIKHRIDQRYW
jgi:hypothetical protein